MSIKNIKNELQYILQGKSTVSQGEFIQTITRYLRKSSQTSATTERIESNIIFGIVILTLVHFYQKVPSKEYIFKIILKF